MKTHHCDVCDIEIPDNTKICPHCNDEKINYYENNFDSAGIVGVLIGFGLILIVVIGIAVCYFT